MSRNKYSYKGPVFYGDRFVMMVNLDCWANSPKKAEDDLLDQAKKMFKPEKAVEKLHISTNLIKKEELKYGKTV